MRPSRRLDEPQVDPEIKAELPDKTPDPRLLPAWMRMPAPRPTLPAQADPPAPLEHDELDATLPAWLRIPPRPALLLPPRKTLPLAELAETLAGPVLEFVDPPVPLEESEVDIVRVPA